MTVLATSGCPPLPNISQRSLYQKCDCVARIDEARVIRGSLVVDTNAVRRIHSYNLFIAEITSALTN